MKYLAMNLFEVPNSSNAVKKPTGAPIRHFYHPLSINQLFIWVSSKVNRKTLPPSDNRFEPKSLVRAAQRRWLQYLFLFSVWILIPTIIRNISHFSLELLIGSVTVRLALGKGGMEGRGRLWAHRTYRWYLFHHLLAAVSFWTNHLKWKKNQIWEFLVGGRIKCVF